MSKTFLLFLSIAIEIFVFPSFVNANGNTNNFARVANCEVQGAKYTLFDTSKVPLKPGHSYTAIENAKSNTYNLPTTLEAVYQGANKGFKLPGYWTRKEIPETNCQVGSALKLFNVDEIIRELYIKAYFIVGEPRPIENIDDLVRNGSAIPLKLRVLCKSDELTDDIALCHEITILDDVIPL